MRSNKRNKIKNLTLKNNQAVNSHQVLQENNNHQLSRKAASNIVRSQIETIYSKQESMPTNRSEITTQEYLRKYHSAWQEYYQKYYEGYYNQHLNKQPVGAEPQKKVTEERSEEQIMEDLKKDLFGTLDKSSKKFRRSRHFLPIIAGVFAVLVFIFLQYNQIIAANVVSYISPGNIDPQNIIIDPNTNVIVSAEPRLIIPKINVDVPVIYDIANDSNSLMSAMTKGVAHFAVPGAESHPGQIGNTVLSGHSSNDLLDVGNYKFIFAQLDKLNPGDTVFIHYQSIRYTYTITKKEVVGPSDVSALIGETKKPILTLITCTPLGTSDYRLLVTAEQISPDPDKATQFAANSSNKTSTVIPGETKSFLEKLFGN